MILSFHPLFEADRQISCAGRAPGDAERRAVAAAAAVVLPQGCRRDLYEMVRDNCALYFPNYDARFAFPGKAGQHRLFETTGVPHPRTIVFRDVAAFRRRCRRIPQDLPLGLPCVFKYDWGGEGDTVYPADSAAGVHAFLAAAATCERTGQRGFLLQEMIPAGDRSLRVVVIGRRRVAYWRVQPDRHLWGASLARGGRLDTAADPDLRAAAVAAVGRFCAATRIDLAGFDLLFAEGDPAGVPYFLEINYFFGRRGLGGSEAYYRSLLAEINAWLGRHNLAGPRAAG